MAFGCGDGVGRRFWGETIKAFAWKMKDKMGDICHFGSAPNKNGVYKAIAHRFLFSSC